MKYQLSIIILSYNTKNYLEKTLASIKRKAEWQVMVVDNASSDGSVEMLRKQFPGVEVIVNSQNLGFAAGNNVGIKRAQGKYVMLLNSDMEIGDEALETLVAFLENHLQVGAVGPKLVLADGAIDLACHRGFPTPWNALTYFVRLEQFFPNSRWLGGYHRSLEDFGKAHPVEVICGGAMMVRKKVIDDVGYLDERFFLYAEDIDWCQRIWQAGWQVYYVSEAKIVHFKSRSGKRVEGERVRRSVSRHHFFMTMKQYYDKYYSHQPRWFRQLVHWGIDVVSRGATKVKL